MQDKNKINENNEDNNVKNYLNIDLQWSNTKKWWDNIQNNNTYLFPSTYNIISSEEKEIFSIKVQYIIKKIFEIDDLSNINNNNNNNKINLKNYDISKLINNAYENKDLVNMIIEDDSELKKIINYIIQFQPYFRPIKKKVFGIIKTIFDDKYFNNLFKIDDDLTKILAPIAGTIFYLYLNSNDIEQTIQNTLLLDDTYILFFVVSYLIVDNFMDDIDNNNESVLQKKNIFFKWFMNIVNNPEQEITLSTEEENIWQCIVFKKYYILFYNKYPLSESKNKIIYDFVKIMIHNLHWSNKIQKYEKSSIEQILEASFKKSYVVSFFMALLINIQLNLEINMNSLNNICNMLFLVQLYDDYFDIDKDICENNYTFFNDNNNNNNINLKVQKIVHASFIFINDLNEKSININRILNYALKNVLFLVFNVHKDKLSAELLKYFLSYSIFTEELINYFDEKSYNQFEDTILLQIIKNFFSQ